MPPAPPSAPASHSPLVLVELAKRHPTSKAEMRKVPGIGPAKIEKYGDAFLEVLRGEGSA